MKTKLIVGLGNPELSRKFNRHNIGYLMIDAYIKWHQAKWGVIKPNIGINYISRPDYTAVFLKPRDGMNLSGISVGLVVKALNILPENILLIHDDLSFDFGTTRVKSSKSSGNHKGVQSIIDTIGTNFARFKVGIGQTKEGNILSFVLSDFSTKEQSYFCELTHLSIQVIDRFLTVGAQQTMGMFNFGGDV